MSRRFCRVAAFILYPFARLEKLSLQNEPASRELKAHSARARIEFESQNRIASGREDTLPERQEVAISGADARRRPINNFCRLLSSFSQADETAPEVEKDRWLLNPLTRATPNF
jgi:hypothetical protein